MSGAAEEPASAVRRVGANAASLLAAYVLPRVCTLTAAVVAARVLGAGEFGAYGTAAAYAVILCIAATLGMMPLLIREIARDPAAAPGLLAAAHRIKLVSGAAMLVALPAIAHFVLGFPPHVTLAALLLGVGYALSAFAENFGAYFQAVERMHVWLQANAALGIVTGVLGIVLVVWTRSVVWFCAAWVAGQAAALAWLARRAPPELRRPAAPAPGAVRRLAAALAPFAASFIALTLYYKVDFLLLARWRDAAEVGIYAAAYKFVDIAHALAIVVASAVYPRLSRAAAAAGTGGRAPGTRVAELVLAAAVPASALLWLLREPIVRVVYGDAYLDAAPVLALLAAAIPPLTLDILAGYLLGAAGRMRYVAAAYAAATVANVALNALLVPTYGAIGSAAAMLGSETALAVALLVVLRREAAIAPSGRILAAAAAAAALCAALGAAPGAGWGAALAYAPAVALLYAWAGVVPREERAAVREAIRGALWPRARARHPDDAAVAIAATALFGCGVVVALAGAAAGRLPLAVGGGAAAGLGLAVLLLTGAVDGLVVLALSLPLPALYQTDAARLSVAAALTPLVLITWFLRRATEPRRFDTGALPRGPTLMFAAAIALSAAFAQSPVAALRESVNFALLLGLLAMAAERFAAGPARARTVAATIAVVAAACGVLAALETVGVLPGRFPRAGTPFYRATLGFGWPNELAMFFGLSLPFTVHLWSIAAGRLRRALAAAGVGACALGLLATFSRGNWLAAATSTLVLLLIGERRLMLRLWGLGLIAAVFVDLASGGALSDRILDTLGDDLVVQRLALQLTGLLIFAAHPIVGIGPGGFADGLERYGPQIGWLWDYVGSAHNVYIHMAAETGIVGLLALLAFFGAVFATLLRAARRARNDPATPAEEASLRRTALWSFTTVCLAGMVEWSFAHGVGQLIMLIAAMGCGLRGLGASRPRGSEQRAQRWNRRARVVAGAEPPRAAAGDGAQRRFECRAEQVEPGVQVVERPRDGIVRRDRLHRHRASALEDAEPRRLRGCGRRRPPDRDLRPAVRPPHRLAPGQLGEPRRRLRQHVQRPGRPPQAGSRLELDVHGVVRQHVQPRAQRRVRQRALADAARSGEDHGPPGHGDRRGVHRLPVEPRHQEQDERVEQVPQGDGGRENARRHPERRRHTLRVRPAGRADAVEPEPSPAVRDDAERPGAERLAYIRRRVGCRSLERRRYRDGDARPDPGRRCTAAVGPGARPRLRTGGPGGAVLARHRRRAANRRGDRVCRRSIVGLEPHRHAQHRQLDDAPRRGASRRPPAGAAVVRHRLHRGHPASGLPSLRNRRGIGDPAGPPGSGRGRPGLSRLARMAIKVMAKLRNPPRRRVPCRAPLPRTDP
ncbi:MAG TPA: oligosaccharide flippase family protein [Longimicrobiales bacterium]